MFESRNFGRAAIVLVITVQLLPVCAVILNAVSDEWSSTLLPTNYSTRWMTQALQDPRLLEAIWHSLAISFATLAVSAFVTVPAVLAGHFYFPALDRLLSALVIVPYAVPGIVLALGLLHLYSGNYGIVLNGTPWVMILAYVPLGASFYYLPIKNNLRAIPATEIFEAGRLVGASDFKILSAILVPTLVPALIVGFVMNFTLAISEFVYANLLVGGRFPTLQILLYVLREGSGHVSSIVIVVYFAVVWTATSLMVAALSRWRSA
jgi:putative spermidine/putrescine transport system permease protein